MVAVIGKSKRGNVLWMDRDALYPGGQNGIADISRRLS
jgi:hypothetical protein